MVTRMSDAPLDLARPQTSSAIDPRLASAGGGSPILVLGCILLLVGVVMAFSTTASLDRPFFSGNPWRAIGVKQAAFAGIGMLLMGVGYRVGYQRLAWRGPQAGRWSWFQPAALVLMLAIVTLLLTLIPGIGVARNGARRWLQIGPAEFGIGFQPSEFAKIAVIIFLSAWLPTRRVLLGEFRRGILPPVMVVATVAVLVVIEDLGTAALIVVTGGLIILAAGARCKHALLLSAPAVTGFTWLVMTTPYRMERLTAHLNIWKDPLGKGYHAIQSLVAIASGGWRGQGLGAGIQKYGYLPEAETDFVFAILCEEMGLVGGLTILAVFGAMTVLGYRAMRRSPDAHGSLLALGLTLLIGLQAAMNIAVVTVAVPTKGISLPLVSAGGSGIMCFCVALGLLASVHQPARPE